MASDPRFLTTQTSILIAGALIAAGLYFGLRGREPALPSPAPVVVVAPSGALAAPSPEPPPRPPAPPPAAALVADRAAATAAATKDLERHRVDVVKKCVEPALAKSPRPPQIKLTWNATFDSEGRQIARGVAEDRELYHEGVSQCAQSALPPLQIPAQGVSIYVELPWTLP